MTAARAETALEHELELFERTPSSLPAATRVWRDFFPSTDQVAREGLELIRRGWAAPPGAA